GAPLPDRRKCSPAVNQARAAYQTLLMATVCTASPHPMQNGPRSDIHAAGGYTLAGCSHTTHTEVAGADGMLMSLLERTLRRSEPELSRTDSDGKLADTGHLSPKRDKYRIRRHAFRDRSLGHRHSVDGNRVSVRLDFQLHSHLSLARLT